jgi:diguanylate cyclase (GGDEF)-like protein
MDSILDSLENEEFDLDELINTHSEKNDSSDEHISIEDFENDDMFEEEELEISTEDDDFQEFVPEPISEMKISEPKDENMDIEKFSQLVLEEIARKKLPPTPKNYKIYFEELLIRQVEMFQDNLYEILNNENIGERQEDKIRTEDNIHKSLQLTEQILNITSKAHTNLRIMKNIVYKREQELGSRKTRDVIKLMKFDLNKLDGILNKQSESMKKLYSRNVDVINTIHDNTEYDRTYDLFNRKYFVTSLRNELKKIDYFHHDSTVLLIIPHKNLTPKTISKKVALVILKTIAKILKQETKESDVVAYYGNNIFGVMLSHYNIDDSEIKVKKLVHSFKESSLFVAGREVEIKVKIGIAPLDVNRKLESTLLTALDALKVANRDENKTYVISH